LIDNLIELIDEREMPLEIFGDILIGVVNECKSDDIIQHLEMIGL
jgi:hypothetical protein